MSVKTTTPRQSTSDMGSGSIYSLPPMIGAEGHDPRRHRAPAFSFGSRIWQNTDNGPGPAYFVDSKVTNFGRERDRGPIINSRPRPRRVDNFTPGPMYSSSEILGSPRNKRSPSYSFGVRAYPDFRGSRPGPTTYNIPTSLGDSVIKYRGAPAIGLKGREEKFGYAHDYSNTPGPAAYGASDGGSRRQPQYSLTGRNFRPEYKMVTPGPGAYNSETVYVDKKRSPRFTIGVKHSDKALPFYTLADVSE